MKRSVFNNQEISDQAKSGNWQISLFILAAGLVLTLVSTVLLKQDEEVQAKNEFSLISNEIRTRIERRLNSHALMLLNGASFFVASDSVSREEWKLFIEHSRLERNLPGVQGVGYSCILRKNELKDHLNRVRSEGFPQYTIKPGGDREIYTSIVYIEPFSGRNLRAFGYDMFSEPVRRKAMEQARDSDVAALSGKVILMQETGDNPQAGTLMYVPVYRNGVSTRTVEERRKAIRGWVYSPYRMNDLMHGILGEWDSTENNRIRLQIYEQESLTGDSLLFDSQQENPVIQKYYSNVISYTIPLVFNGKKWMLTFTESRNKLSYFNSKVIIVFFSGIWISFLLFALYLALSKARSRMNISELLAAQLKESEEKHRALIENATEGIYVVQDGHVAFANKACEAITGIPLGEMAGLHIQEFLDTKETDKLYHHHDDLIAGAMRSQHNVFPINNRKKEVRWLLINSVQIMWNGTPATLNLATDVTQRIESEKEINRKNEELENLNATKDKFFSIIAHDLRSPFNSLLGLTEMMVHDFPTLDREQLKAMVEIIYKSTTNLYRLLENLLQWSQIQSGTIPFSPKPVQLSKIVDESIAIASESAMLKDIQVIAAVPAPIKVMADSHMLQTVFRNLISNAVKFTPKGGMVNISALDDNDNYIKVSVTDTGIGIDQGMIANLFRIDVNTNRVGTEREPSNGLGLLLCKEFVEKHGGEIWVNSKVGEGSTFHFTVPASVES